MKSLKAVLMLATVMLVAGQTSPSEAKKCKPDYYYGEGTAKNWQVGMARARVDWYRNVRKDLGKGWANYDKADVNDESCDPISSLLQLCAVEAYPCK